MKIIFKELKFLPSSIFTACMLTKLIYTEALILMAHQTIVDVGYLHGYALIILCLLDVWTFFMNMNVFFPGPLKMFVKVFYLLFSVVF